MQGHAMQSCTFGLSTIIIMYPLRMIHKVATWRYQQSKWWTWQWQLIGDTCDDNYELVTIRQEIISHCVVSAEGRKVVTNGQLNTRDWEMMATIDRSWWWWWLWLSFECSLLGALRLIWKVLPAIFCSKNVSSINNGGGHWNAKLCQHLMKGSLKRPVVFAKPTTIRGWSLC